MVISFDFVNYVQIYRHDVIELKYDELINSNESY